MAKYKVLEQAAGLVDAQLELLQLLHEGRKLQVAERSRLVCRCPACRRENERALAWLEGFKDRQKALH
jgi:hypothetical protein